MALQKHISELEYEKCQILDQMEQLKQFQEVQSKHLQSKLNSQIQELESKLARSAESNTAAQNDMQRLLTSQQFLGDKWKQESNQFKVHYEQIIKKLQNELNQYRTRISEMDSKYQNSRNQIRDMMQQMAKEKQLYSQLHDHFVAAKEQMSQASRQISQLAAKEAELVQQKKTLCKFVTNKVRENDRLQIDLDSISRRQAIHGRKSTKVVLNEIQLQENVLDQLKVDALEQHIEKIEGRVRNRNAELEKIDDYLNDSA